MIIDILKRNDALKSNPVMATIGIHLTTHGSSWLWAAFSLFAFLCVAHGFLYVVPTFKHNVVKKNLILVPFFTNLTLAFAYFTYASNLGYALQVAEFHHVTTGDGNYIRQIFYTKFIGWFVAWPAALLAISIATSTLSETLTNEPHQNFAGFVNVISSLVVKVVGAEVFVLGLLVGSLIHSTYKWGYFVFAVVAELFVIVLLLKNVTLSLRSATGSRLAAMVVLFQCFVWLWYPLCWALSEGGNVMQPDSEAVFYGILDLITFGLVPTALTWVNISIMDDEFFQKLLPFGHHTRSEKFTASPRHSGDTAVSPPVQQQETPVEV